MENSILLSIRPDVDVYEGDDGFDEMLVKEINAAFGILYQLGVGPETGFMITGENETWNEFTSNEVRLEMVKDYVAKKVKMAFDPPQSSVLKETIESRISEYEWRLSIMPDFIK